MIFCNKYKDHIPQNFSIVYYKGDITMVLLTSFVKGQTLFPHENVKRARKEREKKKKIFRKVLRWEFVLEYSHAYASFSMYSVQKHFFPLQILETICITYCIFATIIPEVKYFKTRKLCAKMQELGISNCVNWKRFRVPSGRNLSLSPFITHPLR